MNKLLKGKPIAGIILALCFSMGVQAKLMIIDFDTPTVTNIFGYTSDAFDETPYGFSGMSYDDVVGSIFDEVIEDYIGNSDLYPALTPGWELDLDFLIGNIGIVPPGVSDYFYFRVGEIGSNSPTTSSLGHACYACALNPFYSGNVVGTVFTDNIATLAGLASNDDGLVNLIAGTLSHEIGHALGLEHPDGREANPGASSFGIMGTGAAPARMPNGERVKDRAFSFVNFDILIDNIGIRRQIPEPTTLALVLIALSGFSARKWLVVKH